MEEGRSCKPELSKQGANQQGHKTSSKSFKQLRDTTWTQPPVHSSPSHHPARNRGGCLYCASQFVFSTCTNTRGMCARYSAAGICASLFFHSDGTSSGGKLQRCQISFHEFLSVSAVFLGHCDVVVLLFVSVIVCGKEWVHSKLQCFRGKIGQSRLPLKLPMTDWTTFKGN